MIVRNNHLRHVQRGGFTLVEVLTVIVIIGILASMIVGASVAVRNAARRALIVADIKDLEMALQMYKNEVGEYPPDFAFCEATRTDSVGKEARARVVRHLRKAWPRMRLDGADTEAQFNRFVALLDPVTVGPGPNQLNPSTALTFWLGGVLIDGQPRGFHSDPANPFKLGEPRSKVYFTKFDKNRLDGYQFFPAKIQPAAPYVYFRAVKDADAGKFEYGAHNDSGGNFEVLQFGSGDNICVPYLEDAESENPIAAHAKRAWRAPETFQILSAGLDGVYSTNDNTTPATPALFRVSKYGVGFSNGDYDNLASFAEGELEDEL